MTKNITSKELRVNFPAIKRQIERGVNFVVYYRSKPLFEIKPLQDKKTEAKKTWRDYIRSTKDGKSFSAVDVVREDRDESYESAYE
jgi:antitoxin (DNA-binding transcriptional repressor) of toxin-antitoxin stability system